MITNKQAILINYSIMIRKMFDAIRDETSVMRYIFMEQESLNEDEDLLEVSRKFSHLCNVLKNLDDLVNKLGEKENEQKA